MGVTGTFFPLNPVVDGVPVQVPWLKFLAPIMATTFIGCYCLVSGVTKLVCLKEGSCTINVTKMLFTEPTKLSWPLFGQLAMVGIVFCGGLLGAKGSLCGPVADAIG